MKREGIVLLLCVFVLFILGLSMVFNTTSAEVLNRSLSPVLNPKGSWMDSVAKNTHHALIKQLLYALLGGVGALGVWFLGYENILRFSGLFLKIFTVLLVAVFVPGVGSVINGAHRWLNIGGYSFQPSEFVKYLIPIYYIHFITTCNKPILMKEFLLLLAKISLPMGLILIEPDNGTVAIILVALFALFVLTKVKWRYWALPLLVIFLGGASVASQMPHVKDRIRIYLHPELDLQGKGHQPYQAKIAAGSGGLFGKGLAESMQKLDYLPEARSDYIAAIFAEEFGFVGMVFLIVLYMCIGYLGFSIASKTPHLPAFYLVSILTFVICFQAFLNLGVVSGLLPSKGTNLPFFSQGGSSLLANFLMVCIIVDISQRKESMVKEESSS